MSSHRKSSILNVFFKYWNENVIECFHMPAWCIAFIRLVVGVQTYICDSRLSAELDVDEMSLRPVRLPVGVQRTVD